MRNEIRRATLGEIRIEIVGSDANAITIDRV